MIFPLRVVCLNISTIFPLSIFHPFIVLAPAVPAAGLSVCSSVCFSSRPLVFGRFSRCSRPLLV